MTMWPKKPYIYEINTAVWLSSLSQKYDRHITLTNVPDEELDYLASLGIDGVWLMGVWYRSKAVRASALNYIDEYRSVLPDITEEDVIGSAYAIGAYVVDKRLGGRDGLASLRRRLQERGLQLILDFVPNHVAIDHAWVSQHPDRFVRGTLSDLQRNKGMFFKSRDAWGRTLVVAHGRDPYFPGWIDTAQLDAFSPSYRQAALETLLDIADQCDGVRCDMAMLLVNRIFAQTWGDYVDEPPKTEFWEDIIPNVKALHPNFIFIAEVYWDMEHELQKLGFDYTYDKVFYDRLVEQELEQLKTHLQADINYQNHTIRFIENHDEPRAAERLGVEKSRPAAALLMTAPGAVLLHDGQLQGRKAKLPVQIRRQPDEAIHPELEAFYRQLLKETRAPVYQHGDWHLFSLTEAWQGNTSHEYLLAHGWKHDADYRLIVVNFSDNWAQALVRLDIWPEIGHHDWRLTDAITGEYYYHRGQNLAENGLFIELPPCGVHLFRVERVMVQSPSYAGD